ncbi:MAG: trypsin-like peptidase domain-containing protein [Bacteroidetes bacterium]|nr:trypsin-like peptidase domain-containing protein [Bacteroidota bacterium]
MMSPDEVLYLTKMAEAAAAGDLSPIEQGQLDAFCTLHLEAKSTYTQLLQTINSLEENGKRKAFQALVADIHNELQAPKKTLIQKSIEFFPRYWKSIGVAACVALITSMITVWSIRHNEANNALSHNLQLVRHDMESLKIAQHQQQKQIEKIKEETIDAPAALPQINYSATGFALSNDGYLVTNYHVVEGAETLHIRTRAGKSYPASVVAYEPLNDIALLKVDDKNFCFSKHSEVPYALRPNKAALGAAIYTLGFPQDEIVYNEGYIAAKNGYQGDSNQYRLEVPAGPGQSGAPVFDTDGDILGVIRSKDAQTESTTYAISSKTLLRLLKDLPKDKRPRIPNVSRLDGMSRQQQVDRLQDFTCLVQVYKK